MIIPHLRDHHHQLNQRSFSSLNWFTPGKDLNNYEGKKYNIVQGSGAHGLQKSMGLSGNADAR